MANERINLNESELEKVVGGYFSFNTETGIMTYSHKDGSVTTHKILDALKAWELSNSLHAKLVPEDEILAKMIAQGYIAG